MAMNGGGAVGHREVCAACKHQRRKCFPDCTLAPYFPADQAAHFNAVQNLYGVSNFVKRLNEVPVDSRDLFVQTMISEAIMRRDHPVLGCYDIINGLRRDLQEKDEIIARQQEEMSRLLQQLEHLQQQLLQHLQEQQVPFVPNFGEQIMQQPFGGRQTMQQPPQQLFGTQMMLQQQQQQQQQRVAGQMIQQRQPPLSHTGHDGPMFGNGIGPSHFMNQA